jgi:Cupredoxin-like domain
MFEEGGAAREQTRVIMPLARFSIALPPAAFAAFPVDAHTDDPFLLKNKNESFQGFDSDARRAEKIVTAKGKVTIKLEPLAGRYPFRGEFHDATAQGVLVVE